MKYYIINKKKIKANNVIDAIQSYKLKRDGNPTLGNRIRANSIKNASVHDTYLEEGKTYTSKSGHKLKITRIKSGMSDYDGEPFIEINYDYKKTDGKSGSSKCYTYDFFKMLHDSIRDDNIEEKLEKYKKSGKFDEFQINEIYLGLKKHLDVSKYAKSEFNWMQMNEIRFGLEKHLDVSKYNNPKYTTYQMREIQSGLEKNLDVSKYADPKFNADQMSEIKYGLEKHLDVSKYADPKFNDNQMSEIRIGLEEHLDVSKYADPRNSWKYMQLVRKQLEKKK